jgi:DNA-binding NarL/FixJ family response regulator
MEQLERDSQLHVVVLKWDRLYGDMIRRQVWDVWPNAVVRVYQRGLDALNAMQEMMADLFVTGVKIEDMDGLEHLEPFIHTSTPVLIVTSRADFRTFEMLRRVRYDGIYDGRMEGLEHLGPALRQVIQHKLYMSPSLVPHLQAPKRKILKDLLTPTQQIVLSVIGDGSSNKQACDRLGMAEQTVKTHRKRIMARLGLHEQGELMLFALRNGFVLVTETGVLYPGFQRALQRIRGTPVAVPTTQLQPEPTGFERPRLFVSPN